MNESIRQLEPKAIWNHFADLNAVPRASKKEERVIAFMKKFGSDLGLETIEDVVGNVIIRKPASPGMEDRRPVIMQSHLDMVHQKNNDTVFDFDTQGIEMHIEGDWVKAKGTTLGADNGLGVATIMAVLASDSIQHPPLEALFTIDEETGMTGAKGLQGGVLRGEILLNLDTEEDDEIGVGCAGGVDITASRNYTSVAPSDEQQAFKIIVKGLQGGHSGMDIHKGLGNANKIMNRLLYALKDKTAIATVDGGSLRNAIPRESTAVIYIDPDIFDKVKEAFANAADAIQQEYKLLEPELELLLQSTEEKPAQVLDERTAMTVLNALYGAHNGVYRMSPAITDLVETSNNIARVKVADGSIHIGCLTRSSVESSKQDLANSLRANFENAGFRVELSGDYPGWAPNMDSPILKVMEALYTEMNGEPANVAACHAGLECGILGQNYPGLDMISFGPTIKGAHSPDERASISSVKKYWEFVLETLKRIPKAA